MELRPIFSALCQQPTVPLLVLLQMAVSLAILANALFIADARHALIARPSGILQERDVFYLRLHDVRPLPRAEFQTRQQRLQQTLQHLPGVAAVATSNQMPMSHNGLILLVSHTNQTQVAPVRASAYQTDQHFLPTLGLALAGGRNFLASEMPKAGTESNDGPPPVVILTQALVRHLYPGVASAVGQTLYLGNGPEARGVRVIGVVTRLQSILSGAESHSEYALILPARAASPGHRLVLRSLPGQRERVQAQVLARVRDLAGAAVAVQSRTVLQDRQEHYQRDRGLAWLLLGVSILLLLVSSGAIIGISSLWVTQRRKQIGIRRALGASKTDIVRYFLLENLLLGTGGVLLGSVLALGLNQILIRQMEQPALPAVWLATTALGLWLLGLLATLPPALRAANIAPALATRSV